MSAPIRSADPRAPLTVRDHDRRRGGRRYVYPVLSRRARGVSVGINLNPDATCNWRCIYCQVPGLSRGAGPPIDLAALEHELGELLDEMGTPEWWERHVPDAARRFPSDVAFSGDGEPTTSPQFPAAVDVTLAALRARSLERDVKLLLITNGSLVHQPRVQEGLRRLTQGRAEVWFKLDGASDDTLRRLNDAHTTLAHQRANLALAARLAPTWVQTMVLDFHGPSLDAAGRDAYCKLLRGLLDEGVPLRGVLLYGLARPSQQPEAPHLRPLPAAWLEEFAAEIRAATGLAVSIHS